MDNEEALPVDEHDGMEIPEDVKPDGWDIDLTAVAEVASKVYYQAIQNAANGTERSKQQQDMFIGISTLGHCRAYATLMMKQTPFSDERDKTAAFFGTVAGDAIEKQLKLDRPDWLIQEKLVYPIEKGLGAGGIVPGTADVIIPFSAQDPEHYIFQGIWDGKSKAELESIRKYGPSRQQIYQIHAYAKAAIKKGLLNPDFPIIVGDVFFDRSGRNVTPYGIFHLYSDDVTDMIDDWINDVTYAVLHGLEGEKDMERDWCFKWCEYASICRGTDTDVEGLITDPEAVAVIESYAEANRIESAAKKSKAILKTQLEDIKPGSTGKLNYRRTWVNGSTFTVNRKGGEQIDIRPVPQPKAKK